MNLPLKFNFSFPEHLKSIAKKIDNGPGVYIFFDQKQYPLYIGKSNHVRSRLLSHFREFERDSRKTNLLLQTNTIVHYPTAGSFSALFKEAELIKQFLPLYNKRLRQSKNYYTIKINAKGKIEFCQSIDLEYLDSHYGIFLNLSSAKETLTSLAEYTPVCKYLCGLSNQAPCFQYQLKRCQKSCGDDNFVKHHPKLLQEYLAEIRLRQWPYPNQAIAIKEQDLPTKKVQYIVIYQWCYLGLANNMAEIEALLKQKSIRKFDKNFYQLCVALFYQTSKEALLLMPVG